MNGERPVHLERVKTLLWGVMGLWAVVTVARFRFGIGATSGLTDAAPWGFWIAFDVMAGVALAAGGFVTAALVYVFGLERFHGFARPAILTALLGYMAVAIGLLYDLGIPWHIVNPMFYPQHHSVLFEVAMCVMCYLTVLALEFSPAVLEHPMFRHPIFKKTLAFMRKITIPLVIAGIVLSTLHQSSLGSLFLIQPFRVHPLWYSPILYVLFYVSAIGLGLMMVTLESLISSWLFRHPVRTAELGAFGLMASVVLAAYALLRTGDLWRRGILPEALNGSWQSGLFVFELLLSAVLPAVLLTIPRVRNSVPGLATCSTMTVLGMIGYRFDICIVAFERPETMPYWPTWTEMAVSSGIVAGAVLVFIFFNENLRIADAHGHGGPHDDGHGPDRSPAGPQPARGRGTLILSRNSMAFILAAALGVGFLPEDAIFGARPRPTTVQTARTVEALAVRVPAPLLEEFHLSSLAGNVLASRNPVPATVKVIDGNRDWRLVPFTHDEHVKALGDHDSCVLCHHQNMAFDTNTACSKCHRDMYEPTDTFDHALHAYKLGGNAACATCHKDETRKSRATALACWQCHGDMVAKGSIIPPAPGKLVGIAPGYVDAMHGLCIRCHEDLAKREPEKYTPEFARCDVCHRAFQDLDHRRLAPYVPMPGGHLAAPAARGRGPADAIPASAPVPASSPGAQAGKTPAAAGGAAAVPAGGAQR